MTPCAWSEASSTWSATSPSPWSSRSAPLASTPSLGSAFTVAEVVALLEPLGITTTEVDSAPEDDDVLEVAVPTYRPDIRPGPMGQADIAEEVARTYGYVRIARRTPSWPQPGRLSDRQRDRRLLKEVLCGLGCSEAWTATFVSEADQVASGAEAPYVEVTNPLVDSERYLRTSMIPGLVRSVLRNAERRQNDIRFFEVGLVFRRDQGLPDAGAEGVAAPERVSVVFAVEGDGAFTAVAAWRNVATALGLASWALGDLAAVGPLGSPVHPYRSSAIVAADQPGDEPATVVGVIGELHPTVVGHFGLVGPDGRPRRVGWLDLDLDVLFDRHRVPRRPERSRPLSRIRRPTSTWRSSSPTPWPPPRSKARCAGPVAICSSRSTSSTSTGAPRCPKEPGAWPSACASVPSTGPSPTTRSARCAPPASTPSSGNTRPPSASQGGRPEPPAVGVAMDRVGARTDQESKPIPKRSSVRSQRLRRPPWASARAIDQRVNSMPA